MAIQGTAVNWFRSHLTKKKKKKKKEKKKRNKIITEIFLKMVKHGVPQWSISGPMLFVIYVQDLPPTINALSEPILFTDNTIVTIFSTNFDNFSTTSNANLYQVNKLFISKKFILNLDKI
jgi:hypothetical protein